MRELGTLARKGDKKGNCN